MNESVIFFYIKDIFAAKIAFFFATCLKKEQNIFFHLFFLLL